LLAARFGFAKATTEISEQVAAIQGASDETLVAIKNVVEVITEIDQIGSAIASATNEPGSATREIASSPTSGRRKAPSHRLACLMIYDRYTLGMSP
jgi:hypothetical protein